METLVIRPGITPKGKVGLVFGFFNLKKPVFCAFAEVPTPDVQVPDSLPELIQFKSQSFSMKNWVFQHAVQANKLLVPCMQVLGIYTCSGEALIENKSSGISSEISELLKRVQKTIKNSQVLHFHHDPTGKIKPMARVYDFATGQNYIAGALKEEKIDFVEIQAVLQICFDFDYVNSFQELSEEFSKFLQNTVIRFKGLNRGASVKESQKAVIFSKSFGKIMQKPQISLRGILESRVFVLKESTQEFVSDLIKQDLLKSFETRFSLINQDFQQLKEGLAIPRRVFYSHAFTSSDYLLDDETSDDGKQRTETLLGFTPTSVQEFEKKQAKQAKPMENLRTSQKLAFKSILPVLVLGISVVLALILSYNL